MTFPEAAEYRQTVAIRNESVESELEIPGLKNLKSGPTPKRLFLQFGKRTSASRARRVAQISYS